MSLVLPLLAFTPLFLLITSPLILGEFPKLFGLIGVILIVVGSYLLNIKERYNGFWGPIKALFNDQGSRFMLAVAFIFSISSNFDKIYVRNSSAIFGWTIHAILVVIILLPIALHRNRKNFFLIFTKAKALAPLGIMEGLTGLLQMVAISMTLVSYVISVKRTSLVLSTLWGYLFFHEKNVKERFFGAVVMVMGVLLITLA